MEACRSTADLAAEANEVENRLALRVLPETKVAVSEPTPATVAALRVGWKTVRDEQAAASSTFAALLEAYPGAER